MKGVIYFTLIAFILGLLIVILDAIFNKRRTKVEIIESMLPGLNCGACGFGSCSGMSIAIVNDAKSLDKCRICKNKEAINEYLNK